MLHKVKIALATSSIAILLATSLAFAQSPSNGSKRAERVEDRCEKVTAALNGRVTSAQARISARETFVANRKTQLNNLISRLQSKGADVSKLQSDATQFASLLDKWLSDYKVYVADLQAAQAIPCGTSQGQFKAALQTARTAHQTVLADRKALQDFVKNTLRVDIKAARATVKNISPTPKT